MVGCDDEDDEDEFEEEEEEEKEEKEEEEEEHDEDEDDLDGAEGDGWDDTWSQNAAMASSSEAGMKYLCMCVWGLGGWKWWW